MDTRFTAGSVTLCELSLKVMEKEEETLEEERMDWNRGRDEE